MSLRATNLVGFGVVAGDPVYIVVFAGQNDTPTITWPTGWTELYQATDSEMAGGAAYILGDTTDLTITTSAAVESAWVVYKILGHNSASNPPEAGTEVLGGGGGTSTPNPPSLTPSWGSSANLWLVALSWSQGNTSSNLTSLPTNYANALVSYNTTDAGAGVYCGDRTATATSEDPGAYAMTAARRCVVNTIAVQGGGATIDATSTGDEESSVTSHTIVLPV